MSDSWEAWPAERIARLRALAADPAGYSGGDMAQMLGVSRSAVIGKLRRLKIEHVGAGFNRVSRGRYKAGSQRDVRAKRKADREAGIKRERRSVQKPEAPAELPVTAEIIPANPVSFWDLDATHCRWPLEPWIAEARLFCGGTKIRGKPWCRHHNSRAWRRRGEPD